jgi:hypothetical protein
MKIVECDGFCLDTAYIQDANQDRILAKLCQLHTSQAHSFSYLSSIVVIELLIICSNRVVDYPKSLQEKKTYCRNLKVQWIGNGKVMDATTCVIGCGLAGDTRGLLLPAR